MIFKFNKQHQCRPHCFCVPLVEDLAFLVQNRSMIPTTLLLSGAYLSHKNDPFLKELDNLRVQASAGVELVACLIELTNAFCSLTLPAATKNSFRVQIHAKIFAFPCLPFGW